MYVLITNDDGIDAPALLPLKLALDQVAETIVFAPEKEAPRAAFATAQGILARSG